MMQLEPSKMAEVKERLAWGCFYKNLTSAEWQISVTNWGTFVGWEAFEKLRSSNSFRHGVVCRKFFAKLQKHLTHK